MIQPFFSVIACCDFPRKIKIMEARFLAMAPCAQDGGGVGIPRIPLNCDFASGCTCPRLVKLSCA
jgi:hypothetical protein